MPRPQPTKKEIRWGGGAGTHIKGLFGTVLNERSAQKKVFSERKTSPGGGGGGGAAKSCILAGVNSCESATAQHNQEPPRRRRRLGSPAQRSRQQFPPQVVGRGAKVLQFPVFRLRATKRASGPGPWPVSARRTSEPDVHDAQLDVVVNEQRRLKAAASAAKRPSTTSRPTVWDFSLLAGDAKCTRQNACFSNYYSAETPSASRTV